MKLNFCVTDQDRVGNFLNIHPYGSPSQSITVFNINFDNIDDVCVNGEAEEIRVNSVLAHIPIEYHQELVNYWARKLSIGGTISFVGYDSQIITRAFVFNQINNTQYNEMIVKNKQATVCVQSITELLNNAGLKIKEKKIQNFQYIVVGARV